MPGKMKKPKNKKRRIIIIAAVLFALSVFAACALYGGLTVRTYEVDSAKAPEGALLRIVLLADLHSHIYGKDQQLLIDMIRESEPDIIALAGDIADDEDPVYGTELLLEGIVDIAPVYYVSGNHELWSGEYPDIKKMIEGYGVTVLGNESRYVEAGGLRLCLCGIDDPQVFKYTDDEEVLKYKDTAGLLQKFSDLDGSTFNILIAHRPEQIDLYRQYDFDLVLSGHTHGGQVRLPPLVNGFYANSQGWFPEYAGGRYDFENLTMIINRGLSFNRIIPRVFNPPEITVINIKGK